jgi:hypothetical protein
MHFVYHKELKDNSSEQQDFWLPEQFCTRGAVERENAHKPLEPHKNGSGRKVTPSLADRYKYTRAWWGEDNEVVAHTGR